MRVLLLCLLALPAGAEEPVVDDALRAKLLFLTDGKSHAVALAVNDPKSRLFWSSGKRFVSVVVDAAESTGADAAGDWKRSFTDPRFLPRAQVKIFSELEKSLTLVAREGGKYFVQCGTRKTPLEPADAARFAGLKFERLAHRKPHALARDSQARYYYVDHGDTPLTDKAYHLFVGPKGALKRQKMSNVVSDSEGDLFATPGGKLRLILSRQESTWIEPGQSRKLVWVPVDENQPLIYNELGVYVGEKQGTPCDDL